MVQIFQDFEIHTNFDPKNSVTGQLSERFFVRRVFCPKAQLSENQRVSCSKRIQLTTILQLIWYWVAHLFMWKEDMLKHYVFKLYETSSKTMQILLMLWYRAVLIVLCKICCGVHRSRLGFKVSSTWGGFKVGFSEVSKIRFRVSTGVDSAAGSNRLDAR